MPRIRRPIQLVAGIYSIRNQRTGAVYVGSTRNLKQRWMLHRCDLRAGRHSSKALQAAWREDGQSAFVLELLQEMPLPIAAATLNVAEEAWHERMIASGITLYSRWFRPRVEKPDSFGQEPKVSVTIRMPKTLLVELRLWATEKGVTLNDLVVEIMRRGITELRYEGWVDAQD